MSEGVNKFSLGENGQPVGNHLALSPTGLTDYEHAKTMFLGAIAEFGGKVLIRSEVLPVTQQEGQPGCVDIWRPAHIHASDRGDGFTRITPAQYVNVSEEQ